MAIQFGETWYARGVGARMLTMAPFIIWGLMLNDVLKGLRLPSIWAYTHYLFNYDAGFVKRGLLGALVKATGIPAAGSYPFFAAAAFVVCLCSFWLLARAMSKACKQLGGMALLASLVFLSSASLVYLIHCVGYFEHFGLLLVVGLLFVDGFKLRLLMAIAGTVFCVLTHEAFFLIFVPGVTFALLKDLHPHQQRERALVVLYLMVSTAVVVIASTATLPPEVVHSAQQALQAQTPIELRADAFEVQQRSGRDNALLMWALWHRPGTWLNMLLSLAVTLPSIIVLLLLTNSLLTQQGRSTSMRWLAIGASLSPLLLHVLARDVERFNALTIFTSFFVLLASALSRAPVLAGDGSQPRRRAEVSPTLGLAALAVMFMNAGSAISLFDGYRTDAFPYIDHVKMLADYVVLGKDVFSPPAL